MEIIKWENGAVNTILLYCTHLILQIRDYKSLLKLFLDDLDP